MGQKQHQPKIVDANSFHEYVPATRTLTRQRKWSAIKLDLFDYPKHLEETPAPGIQDHAFAILMSDGHINGQCKIDGKRVFDGTIKPEQVVVLPRLHDIAWQWRSPDSSGGNFSGISMYLPAQLLETVARETLGIDKTRVEILPDAAGPGDKFLKQIGIELAKDIDQNNPINRAYVESLTQMFAIHVLRYYCALPSTYKDYRKGLSASALKVVTEYIDARLDTEISLAKLAKLTNLSAYYFIRLFKQSKGIAPHQYIMQRRIQKAKHLLKSSQLSILQISIETGYTSASNFSHAFKKIVGVTPRQYRC